MGSAKHKPTIEKYYETGIVVAIYEFLLMCPDLAHLEIRHENPYAKTTKPEQIDLWIRHPPPKGGPANAIECGDFSKSKLIKDAKKLRRLNRKGINWFLAFFREQPLPSKNGKKKKNKWPVHDPYAALSELKKKRGHGGLKGMHIAFDERMTRSITITLPGQKVFFGFALIRIH